MTKNTKAMKALALLLSVATLTVGMTGCGGGILQLLGKLINLGGGAGGGGNPLAGLTGGNRGPAGPEGTPPVGQGAPPPAPNGSQQRPTPPPTGTAAEQLNELQTKYGITLRGAYNDTNVSNTLIYARAQKPETTQGLSFTYTPDRRQQGVLGVWQNRGGSGQSEIYSDLLDVQFHEGMHQVTLAGQNQGSTGPIGDQVYQAAVQAGGGQPADNCITRDYARTNDAEFKAEFFTGLRSLENGLQTQFTLGGGTFNPPENVRAIARKIWADGQ